MFTILLLFALSAATAETATIYPSGATIPVNCLRLSIRFSEAQEEPVLSRLQLQNSRGAVVASPFLEEELWSPDRRTLTILFHPGRLKKGVGPHERLGPPLAGMKRALLTMDGVLIKTWDVASPCGPVDPRAWRIDAPVADSHSALKLILDKPVDMQAEHLIAVVDSSGQRVAGQETLTSNESLWLFKSAEAWHRGEYRIVIHPDLENACGDRVDQPFELAGEEVIPRPARELKLVIGVGRNRSKYLYRGCRTVARHLERLKKL